jgi:hypothetical protein
MTRMKKREKEKKTKCEECVWGSKVNEEKHLRLFPHCVKEKERGPKKDR